MIAQSTNANRSGGTLPILAVKMWSLWLLTWSLVLLCLFANWVIQRSTQLHKRLFARMIEYRDCIARLKKAP
jgi:hypothetical protein